MRTLFTAKEALTRSGELLEFLRVEGHSFRQECPSAGPGETTILSPCNSCERKAAARKQVDDVLTLVSVALSEVQAEIERSMPHVKRRKKGKGKR